MQRKHPPSKQGRRDEAKQVEMLDLQRLLEDELSERLLISPTPQPPPQFDRSTQVT